ncbi:MAG: amino acid ABC transporter permease [Alphaproteobacteria bacterium]|nr:amino acid ABC transporter permease [Alphaproteobacteria bacterium SS10]
MTDITNQKPEAVPDPRQTSAKKAPSTSFIYDEGFRNIAFQVIMIAAVIFAGFYLVNNTLYNLETRNIKTGFEFVDQESGFDINQNIIEYSPASTYGTALVVGLINTLIVAVLGIFFATIIGTIVGVSRLSTNWLIAKIASTYVEVVRNIPLLLQLFMWYGVFTTAFPPVREAWNPVGSMYVSNRGFHIPVVEWADPFTMGAIAVVVAIIAWVFLVQRAKKVQAATGKRPASHLIGFGLLIALPVLAWAAGGAPWDVDAPALGRFNIRGGLTITPELVALLFGLVFYTAGFIAEVVRSGILAVSKGQWEAGEALGLSRRRILNLIVLPQALRVIVPPTTNQYLNLTKNSSLAVAIGYPDLVSVANTTMNQTGQAIESIALIMAAYLTVSLSISAFMNWYNKRIALVER